MNMMMLLILLVNYGRIRMIKIKDMKCGNDNVEFTAMISHVTTGKLMELTKVIILVLFFKMKLEQLMQNYGMHQMSKSRH